MIHPSVNVQRRVLQHHHVRSVIFVPVRQALAWSGQRRKMNASIRSEATENARHALVSLRHCSVPGLEVVRKAASRLTPKVKVHEHKLALIGRQARIDRAHVGAGRVEQLGAVLIHSPPRATR